MISKREARVLDRILDDIHNLPEETMAAHTPGPWIAKPLTCDPRNTYHIEAVGSVHIDYLAELRHITSQDQEANAKLIAAAPELLDSLRFLVRRCLNNRASITTDIQVAIEEAEAIIAKATGK